MKRQHYSPSTPRSWTFWIGCDRGSQICGGIFDYQGQVEQLEELDAQAAEPEFWDDPEQAQEVVRQQSKLKKSIETIESADALIEEGGALYEMAREEADEESIREAWAILERADQGVAKLEFRRMLSGEHDHESAVISINAGAGGVDSQDWAEMLLRMYQRWAERNGYEVTVLDLQVGEPAGIRGAELLIEGEYAYGHLRSETGVHRLVRISPFDNNARRQTSFASILALPDLGDADDNSVEIADSDLRIDKYRASGAGGQHVNKTESAVRLTHIPTGIVVACQAERSQHKNMAYAKRLLRNRLAELERQKRDEQMAEIEGDKMNNEWGNQIRSYVLHPYRQVNDHRTELKTSAVDAILDGALEPLIEAYLMREGKVQQ